MMVTANIKVKMPSLKNREDAMRLLNDCGLQTRFINEVKKKMEGGVHGLSSNEDRIFDDLEVMNYFRRTEALNFLKTLEEVHPINDASEVPRQEGDVVHQGAEVLPPREDQVRVPEAAQPRQGRSSLHDIESLRRDFPDLFDDEDLSPRPLPIIQPAARPLNQPAPLLNQFFLNPAQPVPPREENFLLQHVERLQRNIPSLAGIPGLYPQSGGLVIPPPVCPVHHFAPGSMPLLFNHSERRLLESVQPRQETSSLHDIEILLKNIPDLFDDEPLPSQHQPSARAPEINLSPVAAPINQEVPHSPLPQSDNFGEEGHLRDIQRCLKKIRHGIKKISRRQKKAKRADKTKKSRVNFYFL